MNWRALPKVEFHRHLDGSLRQSTIVALARQYDLDLGFPLDDQIQLDKKTKILRPMHSLQEVLDTFWTTQKVMLNRAALERVAYENVEDVHRDGVVLSELRFAPSFIRVGKPALSYDDIIEGVLEGTHRGALEFGVAVGLIHIIPRSLDARENALATEAIFRFKTQHPLGQRYLVGIDLADAEVTTRPEDFAPWIERARKNNLHVTIHSAEDSSFGHGLHAIDVYQPERIGHGIKLADSPQALERVARANIHLENCPTSNWLTRSVPSLESHPFKKILEAGVSVSLNSDDPHLMGIDLTHEYELAEKIWNFKPQELLALNRRNLDYSFLSAHEVDRVRQMYFQ